MQQQAVAEQAAAQAASSGGRRGPGGATAAAAGRGASRRSYSRARTATPAYPEWVWEREVGAASARAARASGLWLPQTGAYGQQAAQTTNPLAALAGQVSPQQQVVGGESQQLFDQTQHLKSLLFREMHASTFERNNDETLSRPHVNETRRARAETATYKHTTTQRKRVSCSRRLRTILVSGEDKSGD